MLNNALRLPDLERLGLTLADARQALDIMRAARIPSARYGEGLKRYARIKAEDGSAGQLARALAPLVKL